MERKASAKTLGLVQLALLGALIFILAFTPFIGYIPVSYTHLSLFSCQAAAPRFCTRNSALQTAAVKTAATMASGTPLVPITVRITQ